MIARLLLATLVVGASAAPAQDRIRISLERTACFGACPVYRVTVAGDGTVSYDGVENVRVKGRQGWTIDPSAVRALARDMEAAGFFAMQDEYEARMTDMPTTYTALAVGTRSKRIKDYYSGPPALRRIEARIDAVSGARGYIFVSAAAIREKQTQGWRATDRAASQWMTRAAAEGDASVVKALLDAGASARGADAEGVTLVMLAATSGDADTVRTLLAAGGDPTARDKEGRNAADRARAAMKDPGATVAATGLPADYTAVLKLLTDE